MKIFLTGSESFIGKVLLDLFNKEGIDAFGVDLAAPRREDRAPADIRSPDIAGLIPDGTDALVHLAAISRDSDCRANPRLGYDINVMGTVNLIEAAKARGVKQIIFASSEWVYGEVSNQEIQTEDRAIDVTGLKSEYALSKIVGEQILRLAHVQGLPGVTILRFGIVYGPRPSNWAAVESVLHSVFSGGPVRVGSRASARRFIHVSDIARGILAALGRPGFEIFNISGNSLITLGQIIDEGCRQLGARIDVQETAPAQVSIRNPDNAHARHLLGWQPEIDLARGVSSLVDYFKSQPPAKNPPK
jgi:nucleoside-diphosphate-sugar epimerase